MVELHFHFKSGSAQSTVLRRIFDTKFFGSLSTACIGQGFGTYQGNRLMLSRHYAVSTDGPFEVWNNDYDKAGRVKMVTRLIAGDVDPENENNQWYRGTDFTYSTQGNIALARLTRWQVELVDPPPTGDPVPAITHVEPISVMEYLRALVGRGILGKTPDTLARYGASRASAKPWQSSPLSWVSAFMSARAMLQHGCAVR